MKTAPETFSVPWPSRGALDSRRTGSAIAMVMLFLTFVGIVAIATSFQSSAVRKMQTRSHLGFEAVELCDAAINEAYARITVQDVFPEAVFGGNPNYLRDIFNLVSDEKKSDLVAKYPGFKFDFRAVRPAPGAAPVGECFAAMTWPEAQTKAFPVPVTAAVAASIQGFKGPLEPVEMRPLTWRRDYSGLQWRNWGVMRLQSRVKMTDGRTSLTRVMYADRMFTFQVCQNQATTGTAARQVLVWFLKSSRNLKTVIERS